MLSFVLGLLYFFRFHFVFFIFRELCWMRGLCISFTSSCFLFPVEGGVKSLRNGVEGGMLKNLGLWRGYRFGEIIFAGGGVITPLHAMYCWLLFCWDTWNLWIVTSITRPTRNIHFAQACEVELILIVTIVPFKFSIT